jgi:hypothetical protein
MCNVILFDYNAGEKEDYNIANCKNEPSKSIVCFIAKPKKGSKMITDHRGRHGVVVLC